VRPATSESRGRFFVNGTSIARSGTRLGQNGHATFRPENAKAAISGGFSMERTGIEPVTSGLQSRRSPS
jgi:hypothetical protein